MSNLFENPENPEAQAARDDPRMQGATPGDSNFDIGNSTAFKQQVQGISTLLNEIHGHYEGIAGLLGQVPDLLDAQIEKLQKIASAQDHVRTGVEKTVAVHEKDLDLQNKKAEAQEKLTGLIHQAASGDVSALPQIRQRMRMSGLYSRKDRGYILPQRVDSQGNVIEPARPVSPDEFDQIMGPGGNEETRKAVLSSLGQAQAKTLGSEEGGGFSIQGVIHAATTGNIPGVISQMMKKTSYGTGLSTGLEGMGVSGVLADAAGALLTPAAPLVAIEALRRGMRNINQERNVGRITGQGFGAGLHATAWADLKGLNPFDMLSSRQAAEAQAAVREAGFSGSQADSTADLVTDMTQKLGIPISQSAKMVTSSLNDANMSIHETRAQMDDFSNIVKTTGQSMTQYTQAVAGAISATAQAGGSNAARGVAPALAGLSSEFAGTLGRNAAGFFAPLLSNKEQRKNLAIYTGQSPMDIMSTEFTNNFQRTVNKFLLTLARPNMPPNGYHMDWQDYAYLISIMNPSVTQVFGADVSITWLGEALHRVAHLEMTNPSALSGRQQRKATLTEAVHKAQMDLTSPHNKTIKGLPVESKIDAGTLRMTRQYQRRVLSNLRSTLVSSGQMTGKQFDKIFANAEKSISNLTPAEMMAHGSFAPAANMESAIKSALKELNITIKNEITPKRGAGALWNPVQPSKSFRGYQGGMNGSQETIRAPIGAGGP